MGARIEGDLQQGAKSRLTRDRILTAAERLFAEHGYDGVSLREIGAAANAQMALINYHFGTKDQLYRAVFENRITPLNERRRAGLARAMAEPSPTIEAVLDALARPWIEMRSSEAGRYYTRLIAREAAEPREGERRIARDLLDPIAREFLEAMVKVLPDHAPSDVHWAFHFLIGAIVSLMANPERIARLSGAALADQTNDAIIDKLVSFVAGSLRSGGK